MDWAAQIDRNRLALISIVATLFAMVGLGRVVTGLRLEILRTLRPAESAVRRLIVMAARGVVVKPTVSMPPATRKQLALSRNERVSRAAFQLSDPQIPMLASRGPSYVRSGSAPRISVVMPSDPTVAAIWAAKSREVVATPPPAHERDDQRHLMRRLEAIKLALEDLPRQARRLVRWTARREKQSAGRLVYTSPLRPGRAPGLPHEPIRDIDYILQRCHALAREAMQSDTS